MGQDIGQTFGLKLDRDCRAPNLGRRATCSWGLGLALPSELHACVAVGPVQGPLWLRVSATFAGQAGHLLLEQRLPRLAGVHIDPVVGDPLSATSDQAAPVQRVVVHVAHPTLERRIV